MCENNGLVIVKIVHDIGVFKQFKLLQRINAIEQITAYNHPSLLVGFPDGGQAVSYESLVQILRWIDDFVQ
ncbi:hypothetical protein D3C73_1454320 [compost metagenome]